MLRVEHMSKRLGAFCLDDVSFTVHDGEYFVILGESGVGKTVVLELIAGLVAADDGDLYWDSENLRRRSIQQRRMGLVYQGQALFPHMTVRGNIAYGARGHGAEWAQKWAEEVGVGHLLERRPDTLSGGEAQRVALARTLASDPRCLLLDEPLAALDLHARAQLRGLLRQIHKSGRTIVHVTHDYEEAVSLATRIAVMNRGTIVQTGPPEEVFHRPASEFVARFVGIRNILRGRLASTGPYTPRFNADGLSISVVTDAAPGPGMIMLRSEDVTVSRAPIESSAQNVLPGVVIDVLRTPGGMEVLIDIGAELAAMVTPESVAQLDLAPGENVWVSFKATAVRFVGDEA
ncbi:MAG: ABC transporter ATP-binding protein [Candidatus Hydrogenedentes bacterium]|nr:ABC transporter ATP-binding protein [Candidatus Hydrogenedentota bacterium]